MTLPGQPPPPMMPDSEMGLPGGGMHAMPPKRKPPAPGY